MSLEAGRKQLEEAYRDLLARWDRTCDSWHDSKNQEFEKRFLAPLRPDVVLALEAARELRQLTSKVRQDCE